MLSEEGIGPAEPFASFDAVLQRRQHAFRPDRGLHPSLGFSALFSHSRHWRHDANAMPLSGFHTSTFLPPFPRRGFAARASRGTCRCSTMKALTPANVTSQAGLPALRTMPSDHSASNHLTHPCRSFNTLPLSPAGPLYPGRDFTILLAGSSVAPGRIEFVILRTGRSPPVASHPASRRRSYVQFQARRAIGLERTFTSLTSCAHGRTGDRHSRSAQRPTQGSPLPLRCRTGSVPHRVAPLDGFGLGPSL